MREITGDRKVTVDAFAQDVSIGYRGFLLVNSGQAPVYIHDKSDGKAATEDSFCLPAGMMIQTPLCCDTLSVVGSEEGELRLLFLG